MLTVSLHLNVLWNSEKNHRQHLHLSSVLSHVLGAQCQMLGEFSRKPSLCAYLRLDITLCGKQLFDKEASLVWSSLAALTWFWNLFYSSTGTKDLISLERSYWVFYNHIHTSEKNPHIQKKFASRLHRIMNLGNREVAMETICHCNSKN